MYQDIAEIDTFFMVVLKLTNTFRLFYYFMTKIQQHIESSYKERYFLRHLATPFKPHNPIKYKDLHFRPSVYKTTWHSTWQHGTIRLEARVKRWTGLPDSSVCLKHNLPH
jgi:hypothetical protein